jgi:hypothetical protein
MTPVPCSTTSATRTSSTRYATPSFHPIGSRISGASRHPPQRGENQRQNHGESNKLPNSKTTETSRRSIRVITRKPRFVYLTPMS